MEEKMGLRRILKTDKTFHKSFGSKIFRRGMYSSTLTIAMITIVIMVNFISVQLPDKFMSFDLSKSQIYSLGDLTQKTIDNLHNEIDIYIIGEDDEIDERIVNIIERYAESSEKIKYRVISAIDNPTFAANNETLVNSILVKCDFTGRQRTIEFTDIICRDEYAYYSTGEIIETEFDGEGQITSAINYVNGDTPNKIYLTKDHNEQSFSITINKMLNKTNLYSEGISIMHNEIPDDCDLIVIYAPTVDFTDYEVDTVNKYLLKGGNVFVILSQENVELTNLEKLLTDYGIILEAGIIGDYGNNYQDNYFYFFPVLNTMHNICNSMTGNQKALALYSRPLSIDENRNQDLNVLWFMSSSEDAVRVVNGEETRGKYYLGITSERNDDRAKGKMAVIAAASLFNESLISTYANLLNEDIFINTLSWLVNDVNTVAIPAKSLKLQYNTIEHIGIYSLPFVAVIPALLLIVGVIIWFRRRKS